MAVFGSCSSGGESGGVAGTSGNFVVLNTEPQNNGRLFLNESVRVTFSNPVNLETATLNSINFDAFDVVTGEPVQDQVVGVFRHGIDNQGSVDQRILEFQPRFPDNDTFDNGGFKPGRRYIITMTIGAKPNAPTLRDTFGRKLVEAPNLSFSTPTGRTPSELFRNPRAGGPRKLRLEVTPAATNTEPFTGVALNHLSQEPVEVRLVFDQALNPNSANVPVRQDVDPINRSSRTKGRIFMEYDDPLRGLNQWILASVELELNSPAGSQVVLRPDGVLPNNAEVRVIVEPDLEDIAGESNALNTGFSRVFGRFRTRESYESQFDAVRNEFDDASLLDPRAPYLDAQATLTNGALQAAFAFEGKPTILDYEPNTREVNLSTDFTQITPKNGPPQNISGGIFNFRNLTIPRGVTVRGTGSKPMVWLVSGKVTIEGTLSVDGGNGARVDTLRSANFPTPGGVGSCTGGAGGAASLETTRSTERGQTGFGPLNRPEGGGKGGNIACQNEQRTGSGGGGGSSAVVGDAMYNQVTGGTAAFPQMSGKGGVGFKNGQQNNPGGDAGPPKDDDKNPVNNFHGTTVDLNRNLRIDGEYVVPVGGAGGGGGGDNALGTACQSGTNFIQDEKGGGGGGGGGVIIIKALGPIEVLPTGKISADGGDGGGGEQAGSNNRGGGGGGGGAGMVILMSADSIILHKQGESYRNKNYAFSVSADGGVSLKGNFQGAPINDKYPQANTWDLGNAKNTGGFGGMGVVQLMAPPGDNTVDNTNTVLDDNIHIMNGATKLTGAEKQRFLGWRGILGKDDFNRDVTDFGGDIRPEPLLIPVTFGRYSRARTRWIWTGTTVRREITQAGGDGSPRGIVIDQARDLVSGPEYSFAGTFAESSPRDGYVAYDPGSSFILFPPAKDENGKDLRNLAIVQSANLGGFFAGQPVHKLVLQSGVLGPVLNRFANHRCVVRDALGSITAELRILSHNASEILLDPADGSLGGNGKTVEIVAKFFSVTTSGAEGLGPTYLPDPRNPNVKAPVANIQIGFAFHKDPTTQVSGTDPNRYPTNASTFLYDLTSPAIRKQLRDLHYEYVQMDVRFNINYDDSNPNRDPGPNPAGPESPLPRLEFLFLPYRY